jgi:hypothetical protein
MLHISSQEFERFSQFPTLPPRHLFQKKDAWEPLERLYNRYFEEVPPGIKKMPGEIVGIYIERN